MHTPDDGVRRLETAGNAHRIEKARPARVDGIAGEALPRTDVSFDETVIEHGARYSEDSTDELGGVRSTLQGARDDHIHTIESCRSEYRLLAAALGEWNIGTPLPSARNVPLGFTVPKHQDARDRR